jgi:protein subunit release factor B
MLMIRADFLQQFKFSLHIHGVGRRDQLLERMNSLGVRIEDLEESFSRSGGPGGQHVNKVSSAATIRHRPTGLAVTASDSRSQAENRHLALGRLLDTLEEQAQQTRQQRLAAASKARRQNPRRSRRAKAKLVEDKRRRSETKRLRGKIQNHS